MVHKGSGNCCCGGCTQKPRDDSLEPNAIQPIRQFCCGSVPTQICVAYEGTEGDFHAILDAYQGCTPPDDVKQVWRGDIGVDGTVYPLEFGWRVENEQCYLYLSSALTASPVEIAFGAAERAIFCPCCQNCPDQHDTPDTLDFTIDGSTTVKIRPAANTSLPKLARCCDCADPCEELGETSDERPCYPHCAGCGCICSEACIFILEDGEPVANGVGAVCNWKWTAAGAVVELVNSGGCCQLELVSLSGYTWDTQPANVPIDDVTNPCPRPTGSWSFTDTVTEKLITVLWTCSGCGGCDEVLNTCGCAAPRILAADVDSGVGCCGDDITLSLVYNSDTALWVGELPTGWCGGPLRLELGCDGSTWSLTIEANNCVTVADAAPDAVNCDPFVLEFSIFLDDEIPGAGPFCCLGAEGGVTVSITIT